MNWAQEIPFPLGTPWLLIANETDFKVFTVDWKECPEFDQLPRPVPKNVTVLVHWDHHAMSSIRTRDCKRIYQVIPGSTTKPEHIVPIVKFSDREELKQSDKCCVCLASLNDCGMLASCTFDDCYYVCPTCNQHRGSLAMHVPRECFKMSDEQWKRLIKYARLEEEAMHKLRF